MGAANPETGHEVALTNVTQGDAELIRQAISLGDRERRTLGPMPYAAYDDAVNRGTLVVAHREGHVMGYCLYRVSLSRVAIVHLCVAPDARGTGLARRLVDHVSCRHHDHLGIRVKCRRDYNLEGMWIRLGFRQHDETVGRSKDGHLLTIWWRDHGHPNLLTRAEPAALRAAIDLNILRDLVDEARNGAVESGALLADHIADQLELVATPALHAEVESIDGDKLRQSCIRKAQTLAEARGDPQQTAGIRAALLSSIRPQHPTYPESPNDQADLCHAAEAASAGITVLVSRDENFANLVGPAANRLYGLRILRPVDVVLRVDELTQAQVFRPAALAGTDYQIRRLGSDDETRLSPFANTPAGEKPRRFLERLRNLALHRHPRQAIIAPNGRFVAVFVTARTPQGLDVPVLRVLPHRDEDTIARTLVFTLRKLCRDSSGIVLRVTDPVPPPSVCNSLIADGFRRSDSHWYTYVPPFCGEADRLWQMTVTAARGADLPEPAALRSGMPSIAVSEIERMWWPAKVTDSELPTYVVSIKPQWSADLFGHPQTLTPRAWQLALGRDHVYYRSPRPSIDAPARLLWYLTRDRRLPCQPGIIACSHLDAVVVDVPEVLHASFCHLGIWRLEQIRDASRNGVAQALRFSNTDLFRHPVPLSTVTRLQSRHHVAIVPQAPRRIPSAVFASIFQRGQAR